MGSPWYLQAGAWCPCARAWCACVGWGGGVSEEFIAVVTTSALLLDLLESTPRAGRAKLLRDHMDDLRRSDACLPASLDDLLQAEVRKYRAGGA